MVPFIIAGNFLLNTSARVALTRGIPIAAQITKTLVLNKDEVDESPEISNESQDPVEGIDIESLDDENSGNEESSEWQDKINAENNDPINNPSKETGRYLGDLGKMENAPTGKNGEVESWVDKIKDERLIIKINMEEEDISQVGNSNEIDVVEGSNSDGIDLDMDAGMDTD